MSDLFDLGGKKYYDRKKFGSYEEFKRAVDRSSTVYVGNMDFLTREEQVYALFSYCGDVKRVIMGLDKNKRTPCGFCFVEFHTHEAAVAAITCLNQTKLDNRLIRVDGDPGFVEGRQYGRGLSGGQLRDEFRENFDVGRGGFGVRAEKLMRGEELVYLNGYLFFLFFFSCPFFFFFFFFFFFVCVCVLT